MVTSLVRALFLQAFLAVHVQAALSAADLAEAQDVLNKLLKDEQGKLCGSDEIFKTLKMTSKNSNRIVLWDKIKAIKDHKLQALTTEMEKTTAAIKEKEAEKAAFLEKDKQFLSGEELEPFITKALQEGFEEDDAVNIAKCSQCGYMGPLDWKTGCKHIGKMSMYHFDKEDPTMEEASAIAFTGILEAKLPGLNKKVDPAMVIDKCLSMLGATEEGEDAETYCPQMCTTFGQNGQEVSSGMFDEAVGIDEIEKELQRLKLLGKDLATQYGKCVEAEKTLSEFEETLTPLEATTQGTFKVWKEANTKFQKAQGELMDLSTNIEEQEAIQAELTKKVEGTTAGLKAAQGTLLSLGVAGTALAAKLKETIDIATKTKKSMTDFSNALEAAQYIKGKLIVVLSNLKILYTQFVNEFLANGGLDIDECKHNADVSEKEHCLDEFNPESTGYPIEEKTAFLSSMDALQKHCTNVALPSFTLVKKQDPKVDLTPLCDFSGYNPKESVLEVVDRHRKEVDGLIRSAILKWRDFDAEADDEQNGNLRGPELLNPVMSEYPDSSFATKYMPQWSTRGRFLTAMANLKQLEDRMKEYYDKLKSLIEELQTELDKNKLALEGAKIALQKAIADNEIAESEHQAVTELLAQQEELQGNMETNLQELLKARRAAKKAYDGAVKEFDTVFKAGVPQKLSFMQKKKLPSVSSRKTIKRLD